MRCGFENEDKSDGNGEFETYIYKSIGSIYKSNYRLFLVKEKSGP